MEDTALEQTLRQHGIPSEIVHEYDESGTLDSEFFTVIANNPFLRTVEFNGTPIGDNNVKILAQSKSITCFGLNETQLTPKGIYALAKNTVMTNLRILENKISRRNLIAFSNHPTLQHLELSTQDLEGLRILLENQNLKSLSIPFSDLTDDFGDILAKNSSITSLELDGNLLTDVFAEKLAENSNITSVNLSDNSIGDEGVKKLTKMKKLSLVDNPKITSDGILELISSDCLLELSLGCFKGFSMEVARKLIQNSTLQTLDLCGNNLGPELAELVARNSSLTHLNLSCNHVGDDGATSLAKNSSLEKLILRRNSIGYSGAISFLENSTLTSLDLEGNNIGKSGILKLLQHNSITDLNLYDEQHTIGDEELQVLKQNHVLCHFKCKCDDEKVIEIENITQRNRDEMQMRRKQFMIQLDLFLRGINQKGSLLNMLPKEIAFGCLSMMQFESKESIGKTKEQIQTAITTIKENYCNIQYRLLEEKRGLIIHDDSHQSRLTKTCRKASSC